MLLPYDNSDRHKSSLAKLQYIFTRTFCDLQMLKCGRSQSDLPNFVLTWDFLFKSVFFGESIWVFQKILMAAMD